MSCSLNLPLYDEQVGSIETFLLSYATTIMNKDEIEDDLKSSGLIFFYLTMIFVNIEIKYFELASKNVSSSSSCLNNRYHARCMHIFNSN